MTSVSAAFTSILPVLKHGNSVTLRRRASVTTHYACMSTKTTPKRPRPITFERFCKRMSSIQDKRWVHKISGSVCVLSTLGVMLCAPTMLHITSNFCLPSDVVLVPLVLSWSTSVTFLSVSGTVLALRHRQTQPSERALFVVSAFSNLASAMIAVCALPSLVATDTVGRVVVSAFVAAAYFVAVPRTVYKNQRKRKRPPRMLPSSVYALHLLPVFAGVPFLLLAGCTGVLFDHAYFCNLMMVKPNLLPALVYGDVVNGLCAGLGAFTVTMKDRKVLSKGNEQRLIVGASGLSFSMFVGLLCSTTL